MFFLTALNTDTSNSDDEQQSAEFLANQIGTQLLSFMLSADSEELDVSSSPSDLGIDSLVNIAIRNWRRHILRLEITMLEILNARSIRRLEKMAARDLRKKYAKTAS